MMASEVRQDKLTVLYFKLQNIFLCIDLNDVIKIFPLMMLETVPESPPFLAGLMNLAGKSIPVINLALRLNLISNNPYSLDTPIILCSQGENHVGMIVDKIIGLIDINEEMIQDNHLLKDDHSFFQGIVTINEKLTLIINLKKLMNFNLSSYENISQVNNELITMVNENE